MSLVDEALPVHGPYLADWQMAAQELEPAGAPPAEWSPSVASPAGLRTADAGPIIGGQLQPTPYVRLNGSDLGPSVTYTAGLPDGQVVLDGLEVNWGTSEPLEQADPSTATFAVLDFTLTWAAGAALMGLPVQMRWVLVRPELNISKVRSFFEGRVSGVQLRLVDVQLPSGYTVQATRVEVSCTSVEVDDANKQPSGVWPAETLDQRSQRLANFLGKFVVIRSSDWGANGAQPMDVTGASPRDLLLQLYNSTGGDRLVFSTQALQYQWLGRRQVDSRSAGRLQAAQRVAGTPDTAPAYQSRWGQGVYVEPAFSFYPTGVETPDGQLRMYLDARYLEYAEGVGKTASERITRAVVDYVDNQDAVKKTITKVDPAADESKIGQRAVTLDSVLSGTAQASILASDLLAMATQEGSQWRPGTVRWDTRKTGGFELSVQCDVLLRGYATRVPIFVQGSQLSTLNVRPVFSAIGGTIAYRKKAWVVDFDLAGWALASAATETAISRKQHPITWEEIDNGTAEYQMEWHDEDHPRSFHRSVTYEDLAFVGIGYGSTAAGPDTGWDFLS